MDKTAYFEQMRNKRRSEILAAARIAILKQGTAAFNIQQLARDLDISTVTLYKYFKNGEDIMFALKDEILSNTIEKILLPKDATSSENALNSLQLLLHNFYKQILKQQDDLSLLVLFEVHTRCLPKRETNTDPVFPYINSLNEIMEEFLTLGKTDGSMKKDLDVSDALAFISRLNLSMLQHIGLLNESEFKKEKKSLVLQIEQLVSLITLYVSAV